MSCLNCNRESKNKICLNCSEEITITLPREVWNTISWLMECTYLGHGARHLCTNEKYLRHYTIAKEIINKSVPKIRPLKD